VKTDSKTLAWGTIIAIILVAGVSLKVTKFPTFRLPFSSESIRFGLVSFTFLAILVFGYRSLWGNRGFWLLLCAVLMVHVAAYSLFWSQLDMVPVQADMFYGFIGGIEFIGFALLILKIYHIGPNIKWL
jgi:hypothetical protein